MICCSNVKIQEICCSNVKQTQGSFFTFEKIGVSFCDALWVKEKNSCTFPRSEQKKTPLYIFTRCLCQWNRSHQTESSDSEGNGHCGLPAQLLGAPEGQEMSWNLCNLQWQKSSHGSLEIPTENTSCDKTKKKK